MLQFFANLRLWYGALSIALTLFLSFTALAQETRSEGGKENDLRLAPGKLLAEGSNKTPSGARKLLTYKLEEVSLPEPKELEIRGKKERVESVFRLTITGGESLAAADVIWIDDAALPGVWSHGPQKIGALISDRSILRDGAEISVSNRDGSQLDSLAERLKLPESFKATVKPRIEEGNVITSIHSALRINGTLREPMVVIEFRTARPLPQGLNDTYNVQIGKRLFRGPSCTDSMCGSIVLQLTAREFVELKDGALVAISYGSSIPNHSGSFGSWLWTFGPLNKDMLR